MYLEDLDAAPGTSNSRYTSSIFGNAHNQSHLFTEVANDPISNDNLNPPLPVYVPHHHRSRVVLRDEDTGGAFDDEGHGVTFQVIANWLTP